MLLKSKRSLQLQNLFNRSKINRSHNSNPKKLPSRKSQLNTKLTNRMLRNNSRNQLTLLRPPTKLRPKSIIMLPLRPQPCINRSKPQNQMMPFLRKQLKMQRRTLPQQKRKKRKMLPPPKRRRRTLKLRLQNLLPKLKPQQVLELLPRLKHPTMICLQR